MNSIAQHRRPALLAVTVLASACGRSEPALDCSVSGRAVVFATSFETESTDVAFLGAWHRITYYPHSGGMTAASRDGSGAIRTTQPKAVDGSRLGVGFFLATNAIEAGSSLVVRASVDGGNTWTEATGPLPDLLISRDFDYFEATVPLPATGAQVLVEVATTIVSTDNPLLRLDDLQLVDLDHCGVTNDLSPVPPADMVLVPASNTIPAFFVDQYEAFLDSPVGRGNSDQSTGEDGVDGSTTAIALSRSGVIPTAWLSWYQARAACRNAGKRLCRSVELARACSGDMGLEWPYGDAHINARCNDGPGGSAVEPAGARGECVSPFGVYDLSGNLSERCDNGPEGAPDQVYSVGGDYGGGSCFVYGFGPKDATSADVGFRCCKDVE